VDNNPEDYWRGLERLNACRNNDIEALSIVCYPTMPLVVNRHFDFFQKRAVKRAIAESNIKLEGKHILDVGCGGGRWCRLFKACGAEVIGIDIQETTIKKNRDIFPDIDFRVMSAKNLDFPDNCFDVVSFITVLQHIPYKDQLTAVKESARVLKDGGHMLVLEFTQTGRAPHMFSRGDTDWTKIFTENGLDVCTRRKTGYYLTFRVLVNAFHAIAQRFGLADGKSSGMTARKPKNPLVRLRNAVFAIMTIPAYPLEYVSEILLPESMATHTLLVLKKRGRPLGTDLS